MTGLYSYNFSFIIYHFHHLLFHMCVCGFYANLKQSFQVMVRFPTLDHLVSRSFLMKNNYLHCINCILFIFWMNNNDRVNILVVWQHQEKCCNFKSWTISFKTGETHSIKRCRFILIDVNFYLYFETFICKLLLQTPDILVPQHVGAGLQRIF